MLNYIYLYVIVSSSFRSWGTIARFVAAIIGELNILPVEFTTECTTPCADIKLYAIGIIFPRRFPFKDVDTDGCTAY